MTIHIASHSSPMETSECLIFDKICAYPAVLGSIGKSNSPSIVDIIICLLGNFALIIFVVGRTLFSWANTAMKLPMHPELATVGFSCSVSFIILFVGARERLLYICVFSMPL